MGCLPDRHAGLVHAAPPNHGTEPISLRPNVIYDYHKTFEGTEEPSPNDEIARGGESLRLLSSARVAYVWMSFCDSLLPHALLVAVVCSRSLCASSHGALCACCSDPVDMWSGWSDELKAADEDAARL